MFEGNQFVSICQIPNKTMTNKMTKMNAIKEKGPTTRQQLEIKTSLHHFY
jgi:hypothetical protein